MRGKKKAVIGGMVIAFPTGAQLLLNTFGHRGSAAALWIIRVVSVKFEECHGRGDKEIKDVTGEQKGQQL